MDFLKSILPVLSKTGNVPAVFGIYHIICLVVMAILSVLAVHLGPKHSEKTVRRVVFFTAVVVILLEIYKQVVYTFGDGTGDPSYLWYAFPWQFCSTPMYIGFLAGIFRKGRIHNALCAYLATYAVFAGLAVMIYPGDVFIATTGINFQTVVCHGSMVVIGAYLYGSGHVELKFKTVLKAMPVFAVCLTMAVLMNEHAYQVGLLEDHNFNMFYVSSHLESTLPVYGTIHNAVPFPVNLIIYILGFTAAATIILMIAMGFRALARRTHRGNKTAIEAE